MSIKAFITTAHLPWRCWGCNLGINLGARMIVNKKRTKRWHEFCAPENVRVIHPHLLDNRTE